MLAWAVPSALFTGSPLKQTIRYLRTTDGISLAWADAGRGPVLARASNWLTHLEFDWESPVWSHWTRFLAGHFHYLRYDERGCGLTDRRLGAIGFDRWVEDLEAVIDAAGHIEPIYLLGVSQGAAIALAYAVRHPDRVRGLVLYGGYAVGAAGRESSDNVAAYRAMQELVRVGWRKANPIFRQVFTARFIPEGTEQQIQWFNELCRRTTTPEIAYELLEARAEVDVRHLLDKVSVPTLVLHADRDEVIPIGEGRRLAAEIPGAEFVSLPSRNHVLLEHEPAWEQFRAAVLDFVGVRDVSQGHPIHQVNPTRREQQILGLLSKARSNQEIADTLGISEKTVRNHLSHLYEKLGVHTRSQAMLAARRLGLSR